MTDLNLPEVKTKQVVIRNYSQVPFLLKDDTHHLYLAYCTEIVDHLRLRKNNYSALASFQIR
jgi:hypothetical protein